MKKIIAQFVKYPFYGKIIILILLFLGVASMMKMKKATFPIVESKEITITVAYPGASPKQIEEGITSVIEDAIRGIPGIKEFSSVSQENVSTVTITTLSNYDVDELLTEVKNVVDGISNFPTNAEKPVVSKVRSTDIAMFISLESNTNDLIKLNDMANKIEDDFLASGLISQVTISGLPSKMEISVEIDETQLQRYDLSFANIQSAISANNNDISAGTIKNEREEILVISRNRTTDPDDIKNIVVKAGSNGELITIGDIANVTLQFEETPSASYVNGNRGVVIFIRKLKNEDLQQIVEYLNNYIDTYNESHDDSKLIVLLNFYQRVNNQLNILTSNGVLGVILVILVLSLLLNIRLSLWVAWGIPASFLGMFIIASLAGVTINMISLFGMILIIGILVDDGIVIGENIFTHYEKGKSPRRAAIDGTMEVLPAIITSVLTTMIAFLPLFFIEGHLQILYEMGFVVIVALGVSLLEGMFVLPGHLSSPKVLKPINPDSFYGKIRKIMDKVISYLRDKIYLPLLKLSLKFKFVTAACLLALIILTLSLLSSGKIPFTFFPSPPEEQFNIDLALKPGANEEKTLQYLKEIEQVVWDVNAELMQKYNDTMSYVTTTLINTGSAFSGSEVGTHAGTIRVMLDNDITKTKMTSEIIKREIAKKTENLNEAYKYGVGASSRFGAPVSYSILGYDLDELEGAKSMLIDELEQISSLYNIVDNTQLGSQEIRLTLKPFAYSVGLTQASLVQEVRNGYYGALAQRLQEGKNEIWVYVRYPLDNRETIGQLENMKIKTQQGTYPLNELVEFSYDRSLNKINRFNGKREIRVEAYQKDPNEAIMPILTYIEDNIFPKIKEKYPDVTFMAQGQQRDSSDQMQSILTFYSIAFILIVLVIMIYFRSFSQGVIILLMIPLGFMGAVWGAGIHGQSISMMSIWGLVALSGTIINDAIVFMAKYNDNIVSGMKVMDAVLDAGKQRFRAIMLTTITTTAGLMPLIIANSPDAQMIIPMAVALAYGILFGTGFILMLLPHFILIVNTTKVKMKKIFKNEIVEPEEVEVAMKNHKIEIEVQKSFEE